MNVKTAKVIKSTLRWVAIILVASYVILMTIYFIGMLIFQPFILFAGIGIAAVLFFIVGGLMHLYFKAEKIIEKEEKK